MSSAIASSDSSTSRIAENSTRSPQEATATNGTDITADDVVGTPVEQQETHRSIENSTMPYGPTRTDTTTAMQQAQNPPAPPVPALPATIKEDIDSAIGPSSDQPAPLPKDVQDSGSSLMLTLLLTNGARHPFHLTQKYLTKRNVDVQGGDVNNLSVYKLKELILREWREEWEAKPTSPSAIRLITMGKLLDDKSSIKDLKFTQDGPNVVHMTIKPQEFLEDEDTKAGKSSHSHHRAETEHRSPGCRCTIM